MRARERITFDPRALSICAPASGDLRPPARGKRGRILCVGHVMPYPPRAGNQYRIQRMLAWLAQQDSDLLVVVCPAQAPSEHQMAAAAASYPNMIVCTHDGILWHRLADGGPDLDALAGRSPSGVAALLNEPQGGGRMLDLQRAFCPDVLVQLLLHLDQAWRPDVLLAEYVFMTRAFPLLRPDLPKIVDTIDVFSAKADKVELYGVTDGCAMSEAEESELLRRADVLIAIQPEEAAVLSRLAPGRQVVTVGVDFPQPPKAHGAPPGATVLLVGSDNPMNVMGLRDFLRFAWPLVRREVPDAQLRVVGSIGDSVTTPPAGVHILGALDRLEAEYAGARVAINPAIAGTGLKIKTVEALSHLRPVVAWPAGADGVITEARRYCDIARDWPEFAYHLVAALTDTTTLAEMASHREALARLHVSDSVYAPLRRVLEGMRPAAAGPPHIVNRVSAILRSLFGKPPNARAAVNSRSAAVNHDGA